MMTTTLFTAWGTKPSRPDIDFEGTPSARNHPTAQPPGWLGSGSDAEASPQAGGTNAGPDARAGRRGLVCEVYSFHVETPAYIFTEAFFEVAKILLSKADDL